MIMFEGKSYKRNPQTGWWYDSRNMRVPMSIERTLELEYKKQLVAEQKLKAIMLPGADEPNTFINEIPKIIPTYVMNYTPTDGEIELGRYPQGINGEVLPIRWLVVNEDDDKLLLISKFCLDTLPMLKVDMLDGSWYNSYVRAWLNSCFLLEAFSDHEREVMIRSNSVNENIIDVVSLFSEKEIDYYYKSSDELKNIPTEYARKKGVGVKEKVPEAFWWERDRVTPDDNNAYWWTRDCDKMETMCIKPDGTKCKLSSLQGSPNIKTNSTIKVGIRPVIMIQRNSEHCSNDVDGYIFLKGGIRSNQHKKEILYIYKGNVKCHRNKHVIIQATAVMHDRNDNDIKINVEYCTQCKKLLLNYTSYEEYRNKYGVIIGNLRMVTNGLFDGNIGLADESPLKLAGYSVNQQDDLDTRTRQYILASIIYENIMTKGEVIGYLERFINTNGQKYSNKYACEKWREDLVFVQNYNINIQPKFAVTEVRRYNSKYRK